MANNVRKFIDYKTEETIDVMVRRLKSLSHDNVCCHRVSVELICICIGLVYGLKENTESVDKYKRNLYITQ